MGGSERTSENHAACAKPKINTALYKIELQLAALGAFHCGISKMALSTLNTTAVSAIIQNAMVSVAASMVVARRRCVP